MATTQRPRTPKRSAPAPGPNPANRGLLLVGIAVVVGLILIVKAGGVGFDSDSEGVEIGDGAEGEEVTTTAPATTAVPTVAPNTVKVVAANGSDVGGLAGKTGQFLAQSGYTQVVATDAIAPTPQTVVYFAQGFEANAKSIAELLGVAPTQVQPLAADAKLAEDQPADAGVVVVIGPDVQAKVTGTAATTAAAGQTATTAAGGQTTTSVAGGQTTTTAAT